MDSIKDSLKFIAGSDALVNPTTDKQRLCKCINYLLTQYWIDVKDDEYLRERYNTVVESANDILKKEV